MKPLMSAVTCGFTLVLALAALPNEAAAQLISLKTVPVAAGDQFLIYPSRNLGMGGVSIALDDALLDPFVNPAKGGRVTESEFFSAPTFYSISRNSGAARTLPLGALFSSSSWFGGAVAALQQIDMGDRFFGGPIITLPGPIGASLLPQNALSE